MRTAGLLALVLLVPAFVGCIGSPSEETSPASAENVTNQTPKLDDVEAALDEGKDAANLDVLATWKNGNSQEAHPAGDYLFVDRGSQVAILNVSDPNEIEEVSVIDDVPSVVDVKVSEDGAYAFLGDDEPASTDETGGNGRLTGGIYVFDVSDPENPERVNYEPVGPSRGPHMVTYQQTSDGRELVFAAAGQSVVIHEFHRDDETLEELSRYTPGQLAQNRDPQRIGALYNPQGWLHDMFVEEQADGTLMMYVAAWDAGLHVVDVTDPASPETKGTWSDFGNDEAGNLHTVATEKIGDRRITVGAVEVGFAVVGGTLYATGDEKSVTYIWDTTDPSNPELIGEWTNPIDPTSERNRVPGERVSSTHNLQLENGHLYQAHYELGVWVIDLTTPANQTDPQTVAYHNTDQMHTWDVVLNDGVVYTSGEVGVKGLKFVRDTVGGVTSRA